VVFTQVFIVQLYVLPATSFPRGISYEPREPAATDTAVDVNADPWPVGGVTVNVVEYDPVPDTRPDSTGRYESVRSTCRAAGSV
jgi:hypothetical protein